MIEGVVAFCKSTMAALGKILIASLLGLFLLLLVYCLPVNSMSDNLVASVSLFEKEGQYPDLYNGYTSRLDNHTDAMMLLIATNDSEKTALEKTLQNEQGGFTDSRDTVNTLIRHFGAGEPYEEEIEYARYWHGAQVLLKPLLLFFSYPQIRIINCIFQLLFMIITFFLMWKKHAWQMIPVLIMTYVMMMPPVIWRSLQFSACFYCMMIGVFLVLILSGSNQNRIRDGFLLAGLITAYLDLLTYPLITFGVPASIWLFLNRGEKTRTNMKHLFLNALYWGFGYGCMWAMKWVLGTMFTGTDIISDALEALLVRTSRGDDESAVTALNTIRINCLVFASPLLKWLAAYALVLLGISAWKIIRGQRQVIISRYFLYIVIFALPFLWYSFAVNHSYIHSFFTHKLLAVSVCALITGLTDLAVSLRDSKSG